MAQGPYTKHAEALAVSIRKTQSSVNNISVITDSPINRSLFDHVIPLGTEDLAQNAEWKIHNRVRFYELTPYNETVILDADMLFLTDVSHWWNDFKNYDLLVTSRVKTYRDEWVTASPYRKTFSANNLPDVYSAFAYFQKSKLAEEFFVLLKSIVTNWETWTAEYTPRETQAWPSIDVAMAMAIKILDCEAQVTSTRDYPTFTHMKSGCQGWWGYSEDWAKHLGVYTHEQQLRLGNCVQSGILHYVLKDFVNDLHLL